MPLFAHQLTSVELHSLKLQADEWVAVCAALSTACERLQSLSLSQLSGFGVDDAAAVSASDALLSHMLALTSLQSLAVTDDCTSALFHQLIARNGSDAPPPPLRVLSLCISSAAACRVLLARGAPALTTVVLTLPPLDESVTDADLRSVELVRVVHMLAHVGESGLFDVATSSSPLLSFRNRSFAAARGAVL